MAAQLFKGILVIFWTGKEEGEESCPPNTASSRSKSTQSLAPLSLGSSFSVISFCEVMTANSMLTLVAL